MYRRFNKYKVNQWEMVYAQNSEKDSEWTLKTAIRKRQRRSQALKYGFYRTVFLITTLCTFFLFVCYLIYSLCFHKLLLNMLSPEDEGIYLMLYTLIPTIIITLPYFIVALMYIEDSEIADFICCRFRTFYELANVKKIIDRCHITVLEYEKAIENDVKENIQTCVSNFKMEGKYILARLVFIANYFTTTSSYLLLGTRLQEKSIKMINDYTNEVHGILTVGYRGNYPIYVTTAFNDLYMMISKLTTVGEKNENVHKRVRK